MVRLRVILLVRKRLMTTFVHDEIHPLDVTVNPVGVPDHVSNDRGPLAGSPTDPPVILEVVVSPG